MRCLNQVLAFSKTTGWNMFPFVKLLYTNLNYIFIILNVIMTEYWFLDNKKNSTFEIEACDFLKIS